MEPFKNPKSGSFIKFRIFIFEYIFQFADAAVRCVAAIHNFMFLAEENQSRPMDMSPVNAKLSLMRALCFKQFEAVPQDEYDDFLKTHFDSILDFRKYGNWRKIPAKDCRQTLSFPPVIHTGRGDQPNEITFFTLSQYQPKIMASFLNTDDYQVKNFHVAILESCDLKSNILSSSPLSGQYYGLEILRFKTPYLHNQTGFNNEAFKGFLVYNKIEYFDQNNVNDMRLQDADLEDTDKPNWYFRNCFKLWFCSCASGARSKGAYVHVTSVIMGMGASNHQRGLYKVIPTPSLDAETFPDTHISPESILQQRPSTSGASEISDQPSSKRPRQ